MALEVGETASEDAQNTRTLTQIGRVWMMVDHPVLDLLQTQNPSVFFVLLDGVEIYRGLFTPNGLKTLESRAVSLATPHYLMTFHLDDDPNPVYCLVLNDAA